MRNANIIIHAKAPSGMCGEGEADERPQLEISENGRTAILFWVTNVAFLSAALVIVCHTCCHTCGFTMRTTPPLTLHQPLPDRCCHPCSMQMPSSTPQHGDITIKKDSRALMSASWQRGVLADLQRSTTHTLPHTHTPTCTHRHTKATTYPNTLKPKDFYCARYGVLIDTFCIGYFEGLKSQTPKYDKLPSFKNLRI